MCIDITTNFVEFVCSYSKANDIIANKFEPLHLVQCLQPIQTIHYNGGKITGYIYWPYQDVWNQNF